MHHIFYLFPVIVHDRHQIHREHFTDFVIWTQSNWYAIDDSKIVKETMNAVFKSESCILFWRKKIAAKESVWVTFGRSDDEECFRLRIECKSFVSFGQFS
jgi:hypothetical protein